MKLVGNQRLVLAVFSHGDFKGKAQISNSKIQNKIQNKNKKHKKNHSQSYKISYCHYIKQFGSVTKNKHNNNFQQYLSTSLLCLWPNVIPSIIHSIAD